MMLTLLLLRRVDMRGKVLTKINHQMGIKTNLRAKGIKGISFHIALYISMLIIYSGFNTFIYFPIFDILLDPFKKIPSFFNAFRLKYPTRGSIQHLLILMRKHNIQVCKHSFLGELMDRTFEH